MSDTRTDDSPSTPLVWKTCQVCGRPVCSAAQHPRAVHPACRAERRLRWSRDYHARHPGESTVYVRKHYKTHPDKHSAYLKHAHETIARYQDETQALAGRARDAWTSDDDQYILDHWSDRIIDVAQALERTYYAIRMRKRRLSAERSITINHPEL